MRVELREIEDVADEPLEPLGLGAITSSDCLAQLRILGDALAERLHVAADRRQRRPQLVRDGHEEVPLQLVGLREPRGHLPKRSARCADLVVRPDAAGPPRRSGPPRSRPRARERQRPAP